MRWKTTVYLSRKPRKARGGDSQHLRAIGLPLNPGECGRHRFASVGHARTSPTAHHRMCAPSSHSCELCKDKPSGVDNKNSDKERGRNDQTNTAKQQPKAKVPESILRRPTCSTVLAKDILRHQNIHSREQQ